MAAGSATADEDEMGFFDVDDDSDDDDESVSACVPDKNGMRTG